MSIAITGYGSRVVPRVPFIVSFRLPKLAIECDDHVVFFGPAGTGLGFSPRGDATVEDVTTDIDEYPSVPQYALQTPDFAVPVVDDVVVFSAEGRSFEVQLGDAEHRDEMWWIQAGPVEAELEIVGEGTLPKDNGTVRWRGCRYTLDGVVWHKRFYNVALFSTAKFGVEYPFALIAQAPAPRASRLFAVVDRWAIGLASSR